MQQELLLTVILSATALCAGVALVYLSHLHWKAQKPGQGDHLKEAKQLLDELLREAPWSATLNKPQPTEEKHEIKEIDENSRQASERINRLFESTKGVNDHFGVFGGARPPESRDRKGRRP